MKEVWVNADPWEKKLVTTALEAGADAVIVAADRIADVKELGLIKTVADSGDLRWGEDVVRVEIKTAADEDSIVTLSRQKKVLVKTTDWTIIPLENLVARTENILVEVDSIEAAKTALGVLEKGVDGIVINQSDPSTVRQIIRQVKAEQLQLELVEFEIERIRPLGMGDRVCIDTCSMMGSGEGTLVGNSSQALFLIHAESIENPYVSPRPFRVNAGAVHAYVMVPGGKTRYLSELRSGDEVLGVNSAGQTTSLVLGRVKIERRPLLLIEARGPNGPATTICQNAETIRLVAHGGEAISVVKLQPGDVVLGYVEEAGRHFGHKISETITEL
ncbi:MAG: 3-dehydroquinate synthase II [Deltaproteobacteria bacterium]|nr:3-dehydroquinate synthase II [Deltaproteobacteria bacterium]MBW2071467.1 3-dehydroquinate synthase II [Deltaproteobacteria bacterium]